MPAPIATGTRLTSLMRSFNVKVSGKDTEGRCVIFDTIRHKKVGPAFHLHTDCDEWFFVRDGEFKFQVGDKTLRLKSGDSPWSPGDPTRLREDIGGRCQIDCDASTCRENGGVLSRNE